MQGLSSPSKVNQAEATHTYSSTFQRATAPLGSEACPWGLSHSPSGGSSCSFCWKAGVEMTNPIPSCLTQNSRAFSAPPGKGQTTRTGHGARGLTCEGRAGRAHRVKLGSNGSGRQGPRTCCVHTKSKTQKRRMWTQQEACVRLDAVKCGAAVGRVLLAAATRPRPHPAAVPSQDGTAQPQAARELAEACQASALGQWSQ